MITEPLHPPNNSHQGTRTKQKNPGELFLSKTSQMLLIHLLHTTRQELFWQWQLELDQWLGLLERGDVAGGAVLDSSSKKRSEGNVLPGPETGLPLATAAKMMLENSPNLPGCLALPWLNLPQATFLAAWQKKAAVSAPRESSRAQCASLSLLKGLQVTCLHEPGVKHPSSSSSWVLKGQWLSWASWCREDVECNTHFLVTQDRRIATYLEIFENKYHLS